MTAFPPPDPKTQIGPLPRFSGPASFALGLLPFAVLGAMADLIASTRPLPKVDLPAGLEVVVAAGHPLVNYPILGCIDDRGRLFAGDSSGVNMDKKALEEKQPHRIVVLEDTNGDGIYDRSAVFADKFTYPSGGFWLDGSLYFASPPGIWKLTDTNGDSVADRRELVVGGFDGYTGNGTHIHSPVLNSADGRMYWSVGGTGGTVTQKDGTSVRSGRVTGVWSARPDGTDIEWHSLGAMANPVDVDFTPEGAMIGSMNILYAQPRGDTLLHWLYGGVYERADGDRHQRHSGLADVAHTLERMPVLHNFGHVAVAGMMRYRSGALNPEWKDNLFVAFFNTQKIVRVELTPSGATYSATEHEFFKLHDPWPHLTDVLEDADGSLLVLDTGGWFSRGCPSSLGGNAEVRGAVYRIRGRNWTPPSDPYGRGIAWASLSEAGIEALRTDERWTVREKAMLLSAGVKRGRSPAVSVAQLRSDKPAERLRAFEVLARAKAITPEQRSAVLGALGSALEPVLEHAAIYAAIATKAFDLGTLRNARESTLIRRLAIVLEQTTHEAAEQDVLVEIVRRQIDSIDRELAETAIAVIGRNPRAAELCFEELNSRFGARVVSTGTIELMAELAQVHLAKPQTQELIRVMLEHVSPGVRRSAWQILARQRANVSHPQWLQPLATSLAEASGADLALLLDAVGKLRSDRFDASLQRILADPRSPQPLRLKALAALSRPGKPLSAEAFSRLVEMAGDTRSPTARIDAARFISRARLTKEQLQALTPVVGAAGPIELQEYLRLKKAIDPESAELWAQAVAKSPVLSSIEESVIRSGFQSLPAVTYERILGPAVRAAAAAHDARKRQLEALAARVAEGRPAEGRKVFESSACVACHQVGELGRPVGPDLSRIGNIRVGRDILGKILFPNDIVAQGYETVSVETADGQNLTGTIKNESVEGLVIADLAGQMKTIPHAQIVGKTVLPTSLMPVGLEQTMTEQQLLDLAAWLVSHK